MNRTASFVSHYRSFAHLALQTMSWCSRNISIIDTFPICYWWYIADQLNTCFEFDMKPIKKQHQSARGDIFCRVWYEVSIKKSSDVSNSIVRPFDTGVHFNDIFVASHFLIINCFKIWTRVNSLESTVKLNFHFAFKHNLIPLNTIYSTVTAETL